MKTKEYFTEDFEREFEKAETITTLQELFQRMNMQRVKWIADGGHSVALLDEQTGIVKWELDKLRQAQSRGRYRAYYAFMKMLDEHYPYKTPLLSYKYILEDGVNGFKKEILSNMVHLSGETKDSYLTQMKSELEGLLKNVYAREDTLEEWYSKYNTSEKEVFAPVASGHRNLIYEMLKSSTPGFAGEDEAGADEFHIQNDFYNVFYGRAIKEVLDLVNNQVKKYEEWAKYFSLPERIPVKAGSEVQEEREIKELEDLFYHKSYAEYCIDILREDEFPLIGDQYNYIGKLKGGLCVWIEELDRQSIIKHQSDKVYAELLRKRFSGLAPFHFSLFRKTNNKAEERYRDVFRKKIESIRK